VYGWRRANANLRRKTAGRRPSPDYSAGAISSAMAGCGLRGPARRFRLEAGGADGRLHVLVLAGLRQPWDPDRPALSLLDAARRP